MSAGAAKAGRLCVIKIGDGGNPEAFNTIGGLKASSIKINADAIDVTDMASNDWHEILDAYGIKKVSISGSGVFKNDTYEQSLRTKMLNETLTNFQLVDGDGKIWQGSFKIKDLEYKGSDKDAISYSLSLESSGAVTFT